MFESREEIQDKLQEYKESISVADEQKIQEIIDFLSKYGYLADLRDALVIYITKFINNKIDQQLKEYQKSLSIFPEDDDIFEKFVTLVNNINIDQQEKSIYLKTYIKVLSTVGKFGKAINIINEIINSKPDDVDTIILAANVYETEGHIDKAVEFYLKAVDRLQNLDEKIKLREQISVIDPANKENIMQLVELYKVKKEYELSSKMLRNLLRYNQNDAEVLYKIAEIDNLKGNYRGANIAIKRALDIEPENPKYKFLLAVISYNMGSKNEAEKILDQIILELYQKEEYTNELKEALNVLSTIKSPLLEKYQYILDEIKQKEQELQQELIQQNIDKEIYEQETNIEKFAISQETTFKRNLEERETLPRTPKRSTGVYIKKETPVEMPKKTLISKKDTLIIKESAVGLKQSPFAKKENLFKKENLQSKNLDKPTLQRQEKTLQDKPTLQKPTLQKPILEKGASERETFEKPIFERPTLEKPKLTKIAPELTAESTPEPLIESTIQEKELEIEQNIEVEQETTTLDHEKIKNIEIEIYENTLSEILSNFDSLENVIKNSIILIENIAQLSDNKYRLLLWIHRILVIASIYNLQKIKQKLITLLETLGYQKVLEYINEPTKTNQYIDPVHYLLEEIATQANYQQLQYALKEIVRYTIVSNLVYSFIKIYQIMNEKFPENISQTDKIFADVINEEKNVDFAFIFLDISNIDNVKYINTQIIEDLINNNEYVEIIERINLKTKANIIIKALQDRKISIIEKVLQKTVDVVSLMIELYNSTSSRFNITLEEIQDVNTKIVLYPILENRGKDDEIYLDKTKNKAFWTVSYFFASKYPYLILTEIDSIKDILITCIEKIKQTEDNFKRLLIEILKLIIQDQKDEIENYIAKGLQEFDNPNEQFMLTLIQAWYKKKYDPEESKKIIQKLELIIDEIKEKELLDFYKLIKYG
ncbi:MAG: tetratricopeptide repeat protein [bacterium]